MVSQDASGNSVHHSTADAIVIVKVLWAQGTRNVLRGGEILHRRWLQPLRPESHRFQLFGLFGFNIGPDDSDDSHLTQNACTLYGLIHARYIITAHGLDAMYNKVNELTQWALLWGFVEKSISRPLKIKYAAKEFGTCPLVQCAGQPVLPVRLG